MIIQTRNTRYTVVDMGDGAFTVQGNQKYCPSAMMCRLLQRPMAGDRMAFSPLTGPHAKRLIITSPIQSVEE